jgi:hypothetical protein
VKKASAGQGFFVYEAGRRRVGSAVYGAANPKRDFGAGCGQEFAQATIPKEALGRVDCRITHVPAGGDHGTFFGEIPAGGHNEEGRPLLFNRREYRKIAD